MKNLCTSFVPHGGAWSALFRLVSWRGPRGLPLRVGDRLDGRGRSTLLFAQTQPARQPSTARCRGRHTPKAAPHDPLGSPDPVPRLSCQIRSLRNFEKASAPCFWTQGSSETIDNAAHPPGAQAAGSEAEENENVFLYTKSARACRASRRATSEPAC